MAGRKPDAGARPWIPRRPTLKRLRESVQDCQGCDLYRDATQAVMGDGPVPAPLMLIGEQPGDKEDIAGEPFVGPAGRLLDAVLEEAGIGGGDSVYKTNAVKHFRFGEVRRKQRIHKSPSGWQIAACQPWLIAELELVQPCGVVLLGATAGRALYGSSFRLGDHRGQLEEWPAAPLLEAPPRWVLATTHPSAVLRSREREEAKAALVADLAVAADALAG